MQQQNAGAAAIKPHAAKGRAILLGIYGVTVVHSYDLQSIDFNFFIVQHTDARSQ